MSTHSDRTVSWLGFGVAALVVVSLALPTLIAAPARADTPPITLTADPQTLPASGGQVKIHIRLHDVKDAKLDGQSLHGDKIDKKFNITQTTTYTVTAKDKNNNDAPVTESITVTVAVAGTPTPSPTPAPTPISVSTPLAGEFALQTGNGRFLTALGGGGKAADAVHTDATKVGGWEKFRLVPVGPGPASGRYYAIMTSNGHYVTAVNGGGATGDALHTDATKVAAWEIFRLVQQPGGYFAIQTVNGYYLTAVGGGGKTTDPIHTDGKNAAGWEMWRLVKIGDLYNYVHYAIWSDFVGRYLSTSGAGGPHNDSIEPKATSADSGSDFELVRQPDGTYAMARLPFYVTALGGGGKGSAPFHFDATQIGAWEKFSFSDQGDGTYIITTSGGGVLGINDQAGIATNGGVNHNSQLFRLIVESGF